MITGFTYIRNSDFTQADIDAIFAEIKNRFAGASVQENTDTVFRVGPACAVPGQYPDDTPLWLFKNQAGRIFVQAYAGEAGGSVGSRITEPYTPLPVISVDVNSLYFACSPDEGWWWSAVRGASAYSDRFMAGCRFRRVAADMTVGVYPRFGILSSDYGLSFHLPYGTYSEGTHMQAVMLTAASPMGTSSAARPSGSPLPAGIAPVYPQPSMGYSPAIFGDADCAMMATDGFAYGEEAAPGWRVFSSRPGASSAPAYVALRSPATFDAL